MELKVAPIFCASFALAVACHGFHLVARNL